jgi:hypothetical protein
MKTMDKKRLRTEGRRLDRKIQTQSSRSPTPTAQPVNKNLELRMQRLASN